MTRALPFIVGLSALSACGATDGKTARHRLEGSLTQLMSLGYDEVRVLPSTDDVALLFVRLRPLGGVADGGSAAGSSEDYPFKVTVKRLGDGPLSGTRLDLTEPDGASAQRGVFSRDVQNDPRKALPQARRSSLYFDASPDEAGATVRGDFHVTFEDGVEVASGRTVFGTFEAKVVP